MGSVSACKAQSEKYFTIFSEEKVPVVKIYDESNREYGDYFAEIFEKVTGIRPAVVERGIRTTEVAIVFDPPGGLDEYYFELEQSENLLTIKASNGDEIYRAIHHFFIHYAGFINWSVEKLKPINIKEIKVPLGLKDSQQLAFDYREPYFQYNWEKSFRTWNSTQTLDEVWGIWGHNIAKNVEVTADMLATVDNVKVNNQFCFSSKALEDALVEAIKQKKEEWAKPNKFMIMPEDNALVCTCEKCKSHGNTLKNASPAVFTMLNKVAERLPQQQLYSTAYITTDAPPPFKLRSNVGVMVSTMSFEKGVVIEGSNQEAKIRNLLNQWKELTNTIYLWDYAINFDNYFESYPTLQIQQKNLQFFLENGVTGVFMQGNEAGYAAFSSLKSFVYSQLLQNPSTDVKKLIDIYFKAKYPLTGEILAEYYQRIDERAFQSRRTLDIYGNWESAIKKYLLANELTLLLKKIDRVINQCELDEVQALNPLLAALYFQRLELMRINGIGMNGYAGSIDDNYTARVSDEAKQMFNKLSAYIRISNLEVFNESGFLLSDYLEYWNKQLLNNSYKNYAFGKKLKPLGKMDEGYPIKMINDGAVGFFDYNNNWMINSVDALSFEIAASEVYNTQHIRMCFLNNVRHRIHLPQKVIVTIGDRRYETNLELDNVDDKEITKQCVEIPVKIISGDNKITVQVVKQAKHNNLSTACDEVYFY
ncbi:MAG: DUF4838 domain-containing protein [Cryomorphaceae bacterium]|nr:DUF4838 domain-containing protein [Cryomorphaceae bacterium]